MAPVSRPASASDLYGLPLDRFTEERGALARRLREQGQRDQAAEVAKLRKPSLAAWAVNQLVRTQKRDFGALLKAGDALQRAQAALLDGSGDPAALREAADAERTARERLLDKARGLLSSEGHELQPAKLEQVSDTLQAAAIDERARGEVQDGCLLRELRHVGLGAFGGGVAAGASGSKASRRRGSHDDDAKRKEQERAATLKAARRAEAAARRQHERAQRRLQAAEERLERVSGELREAQGALDTAREDAEKAQREHERTQQALKEL